MSALAPLAEREFRLLFVGRTVSVLGNSIAPIAIAFAVLDLTGSATDLGLVLAAFMLARTVFLLLGGTFGDRLSRRRVMVVSNVLSTVVQAVTAALLIAGVARLWHLVVLQAAAGAVMAFFQPAARGLVPETVAEPHLQQANALYRLGLNAMQIGGAALGGLVVAAAGAGWAFALDAATFAVSAVVLALLRAGRTRIDGGRFVADLVDGWRAFASREWLWVVVVAFTFMNFADNGAIMVLGPVTAKEELGGAAAWGAVLAVEAAGLIAGGVLALRVRVRRPLYVGQALSALLALPLLALARPLPVVAIALVFAVAGAGIEMFSVLWETALQRNVPPSLLARVAAWDSIGSFVAIPAGTAAAGPVAAAIGRGATLYGAAAVTAVAALAALASREVRTLCA